VMGEVDGSVVTPSSVGFKEVGDCVGTWVVGRPVGTTLGSVVGRAEGS
jgi:hypothetical protein